MTRFFQMFEHTVLWEGREEPIGTNGEFEIAFVAFPDRNCTCSNDGASQAATSVLPPSERGRGQMEWNTCFGRQGF